MKQYSLYPNHIFYKMTETSGYLVTSEASVLIRSSLLADILIFCGAGQTDEQIASKLQERYALPDIFYGILRLENDGYLTAVMPWHDYSSLAKSILITSEIFKPLYTNNTFLDIRWIFCFSPCDEQPQKISTFDTHAGANITILVTNDFFNRDFLSVSQQLSDNGECFYPVQIHSDTFWSGPLFGYNHSSCWQCFLKNIERINPVKTYAEKFCIVKNAQYAVSCSDGYSEYLVKTVVDAITHSLVNSSLHDRMMKYTVLNRRREEFTLLKDQGCFVCGDRDWFLKQALSPVILEKTVKKCKAFGGFRVVSPYDTWEHYKHLTEPVTGIVFDLKPLEEKNHPIRPVWHAAYYIHPVAPVQCEKELFIKKSFGKGQDQQQAKISAFCESIERYSSVYQGYEPCIRNSYCNLPSEKVIHPYDLLNFSEKQYQMRDEATDDPVQQVPEPFDEQRDIEWTYAWSLTQSSLFYVPLSYCYSYSPNPESSRMCPFNPNGHATGNTLSEAILQGLLELIERDAVGIWWYNMIPRKHISLESFNDIYFDSVQKEYHSLGWDVWLLDITTDIEIPVCVAIGYNVHTKGIIIGMGSHLSLRLAAERAITEMHQVFHPKKEDNHLWKTDVFKDNSFLFPVGSVRYDASCEYQNTDYIEEDIQYCQKKIESQNLSVLLVNYTRPETGMPSVKMIVPGLRHFWRRLGPGRMYDVPVIMQWMSNPRLENELNDVTLKI